MKRRHNNNRVMAYGVIVSAIAVLGVGCDFETPDLSELMNNQSSAVDDEQVADINSERASLEVAMGQSFTIQLESNETTGYRWSADFNRTSIEFIKDEYVPHEWDAPPDLDTGSAPPGKVGVGGIHYFTFSAIRPSSSQIKFEYKRPWEDEALQMIIYEITAK